jgi:hypothetical protein
MLAQLERSESAAAAHGRARPGTRARARAVPARVPGRFLHACPGGSCTHALQVLRAVTSVWTADVRSGVVFSASHH